MEKLWKNYLGKKIPSSLFTQDKILAYSRRHFQTENKDIDVFVSFIEIPCHFLKAQNFLWLSSYLFVSYVCIIPYFISCLKQCQYERGAMAAVQLLRGLVITIKNWLRQTHSHRAQEIGKIFKST